MGGAEIDLGRFLLMIRGILLRRSAHVRDLVSLGPTQNSNFPSASVQALWIKPRLQGAALGFGHRRFGIDLPLLGYLQRRGKNLQILYHTYSEDRFILLLSIAFSRDFFAARQMGDWRHSILKSKRVPIKPKR